jgi:NADH-quinone oxidoreductase subunit N
MLFKVAAVPFHFWAPDVYEGSPALTTALMSTLAKVVAIATLYKLLSVMNADVSESFKMVVVIISMASMSVGNIILRQTNVKRMLAFSGISHWFYVDDFVEFVYIGRKFIILLLILYLELLLLV